MDTSRTPTQCASRARKQVPLLLAITIVAAAAIAGADYLACVGSLQDGYGDYYQYATKYQEQQCTLLRGPLSILILSHAAGVLDFIRGAHNEIIALSAVGILLALITLAYYTRGLSMQAMERAEQADALAAQQAR